MLINKFKYFEKILFKPLSFKSAPIFSIRKLHTFKATIDNECHTLKLNDNLKKDNSFKIDFSWLRDHCQCPKCIHPSTGQKLINSGKINPKIKLNQVDIIENKIKLNWLNNSIIGIVDEGHESLFDIEFLLNNQPIINNSNCLIDKLHLTYPSIPWNNNNLHLKSVTFSYDLFKQQSHFKKVLISLQEYGLAILKDVPIKDESVIKVGEKIGEIYHNFYGKSWDVKSVPQAKNIAYTSLDLGFHMDLLYFESPPAIQLLHCLSNEVTGGHSLFTDGLNAIDKLKEQYPIYYETLLQTQVTFHYSHPNRNMNFSRPTILPPSPNHPQHQLFYSPPFMAPLKNLTLDQSKKFYKAFNKLTEIMELESNKIEFKMKQGDLVLFDNRRLLHARSSFDSNQGNRHLKGTYIPLEEFRSKLRILM